MLNKLFTSQSLIQDKKLTIEEILTLTNQSYLTMVQNGRLVKLWTIMLTPELAKRMLESNVNNRQLNQANLRFLKNEVVSNRWREISDPIQINEEDKLINGQHRLRAIVDLNISLPLRVETNVDSTIFSVIDTGNKRSGVDTLTIKHIENASVMATTIRYIKMMLTNGNSTTKVSNQEMINFIEDNPNVIEAVKFGVSNYKKGNKVITAPLLSTFYFLLTKNYKNEAEEFLLKIALGNDIQPNCPSGAIRNRFITLKSDKNKNVKGEKNMEYIAYAWNKFLNGEKVKSIKLPNERVTLIM